MATKIVPGYHPEKITELKRDDSRIRSVDSIARNNRDTLKASRRRLQRARAVVAAAAIAFGGMTMANFAVTQVNYGPRQEVTAPAPFATNDQFLALMGATATSSLAWYSLRNKIRAKDRAIKRVFRKGSSQES